MTLTNPVYLLIHFTPAVILILCAVFMFVIRGNKGSSKFAAWGRLLTGIMLLANVFQTANSPEYYKTLWNPMLLLLLAASFYLFFAYMLSLLSPRYPNRKFWLLTYLPTGLLFVALFIIWAIRGIPQPITDYDMIEIRLGEPEIWLRFAILIVFIIQFIVVLMLCLSFLQKHKQNIMTDFSYTEGINLNWIYFVIVLCILEITLTILCITMENPVFKLCILIMLFFEPVVTSIFIIRQKEIYHRDNIEDEQTVTLLTEEVYIQNQKTGNFNGKTNLKNRLLELFEKDEIYKDPELNSEKVCRILGTNRTYLSQIINQELNTNFYNLVNSYRLNKAVELIEQPLKEKMSLKTITAICGFKSQSAFTIYFKEKKGCSPREWKAK